MTCSANFILMSERNLHACCIQQQVCFWQLRMHVYTSMCSKLDEHGSESILLEVSDVQARPRCSGRNHNSVYCHFLEAVLRLHAYAWAPRLCHTAPYPPAITSCL